MHIVVVAPNKSRAFLIVDGLRDAFDFKVTVIGETTGLARKLNTYKPDYILVDLEDPTSESFDQVIAALMPSERPVAMFIDKSDETMMRAAIYAGVSAYVVDGLRQDRVKPIMETAIARFKAFDSIKSELAASKMALAERKVVDRAKGLLMDAKKLSEEEAYKLLRKAAMDQGKRLPEIAAGLVSTASLLS